MIRVQPHSLFNAKLLYCTTGTSYLCLITLLIVCISYVLLHCFTHFDFQYTCFEQLTALCIVPLHFTIL